jgi:hypothetical protein
MGGTDGILMRILTGEQPRKCSRSPVHFSGEEELGVMGPREFGGWIGRRLFAPCLHVSFWDKSISRTAVVHLHPAAARRPAAPVHTLHSF